MDLSNGILQGWEYISGFSDVRSNMRHLKENKKQKQIFTVGSAPPFLCLFVCLFVCFDMFCFAWISQKKESGDEGGGGGGGISYPSACICGSIWSIKSNFPFLFYWINQTNYFQILEQEVKRARDAARLGACFRAITLAKKQLYHTCSSALYLSLVPRPPVEAWVQDNLSPWSEPSGVGCV